MLHSHLLMSFKLVQTVDNSKSLILNMCKLYDIFLRCKAGKICKRDL